MTNFIAAEYVSASDEGIPSLRVFQAIVLFPLKKGTVLS